MRSPFHFGVALALAASIAGCASPPSTAPSAVVISPRTKLVSADRVNAVTIGKSTKADVRAALGETLVIGFDTGYEVWVYELAHVARVRETLAQRVARRGSDKAVGGSNAEFVILFSPTGVVAKTRVRPGSPPG